MAINFPNNPSVNDTFTVGGTTFTFTGVKWESSAVVELSSDTTPSLGGDLDGGAKNINNVGVITATGLDINGDADISGNLSVQGTTTTIDTAVTSVDSLAVDGNVTAGGSVGIGTDNPGTSLEVFTDDDTDISGNTGTNNTNSILRLYNKNGTDGTGVNNYTGIRFDVASGARSSAYLNYVRTGDNQGAFLFKARNAASSYPELLRITSAGDVGIGTDNPGTKLDVRGGNWANGDIVLGQSGNAGRVKFRRGVDGSDSAFIGFAAADNNNRLSIGVDSGDGIIAFQTNSAERVRITSDGSVAIGTATGETNFLTTINGDLSLGEKNGADNTFIDQKQNGSLEIINSGRTANSGSVRINRYNNISGDTTYFRDFVVYDGKETALLTVDGSAGTVSDSKGGLRDIPLNDESTNASYTLVASDAGKVVHAHSTTTTVVVPNSVFSVGNVVTILNGGTSNISISQGSGFSLRNSVDGSSGGRTLAQFGMATIYFTSASIGYISGSNMT